jgi:hypothetical protein
MEGTVCGTKVTSGRAAGRLGETIPLLILLLLLVLAWPGKLSGQMATGCLRTRDRMTRYSSPGERYGCGRL